MRKDYYAKSEEELLSILVGLNKEAFAWAAPATWAALAEPIDHEDLDRDGEVEGYRWIRPKPFSLKIFFNVYAEEGRIYLSHAGREYLEHVEI